MASRLQRAVRTSLLALIAILVAGSAVVFLLSERRLSRRYPVPITTISVRADSAGVARGEHLYRTITCATCHAPDGGGAVYSDAGAIGVIAGPNLTRGLGGVAASRTDADWVRAIRYGVHQDSTSLVVMPAEVFTHLNDADLGALIGYIRQLRPVDRQVPTSRFRWLGRVFLAAGRLNILVAPKVPAAPRRDTVSAGATAAFGRYLADIGGCHGCHGYGLSGGTVAGPPGLPPAANLTPTALRAWTESTFVSVIRTGRRADGTTLNEFMPWKEFRNMSDVELAALWQYLASVPPKAFGGK